MRFFLSLREIFGIHAISGLLRQTIYLFIAQCLKVAFFASALVMRLYHLQRRRPRVSFHWSRKSLASIRSTQDSILAAGR